jgi:hypothetical protein
MWEEKNMSGLFKKRPEFKPLFDGPDDVRLLKAELAAARAQVAALQGLLAKRDRMIVAMVERFFEREVAK